MLRARLVLTCIVAIVAACATTGTTPRSDCGRLRDHLLDLRLSGALPTGEAKPLPEPHDSIPAAGARPMPPARSLTAAQIEAHRRALSHALGDDLVSSCETTFSRRQIDCVLAATDSTAAAGCTN
jgi:hypothetical protein